METRIIDVICEVTGKPFKLEQWKWDYTGSWFPNKKIHPDELDRQLAEQRQQSEKAKELARIEFGEDWILENVPKGMSVSDPKHEGIDRKAFRLAVSWKFKGKGLVLEGSIRKGKTRAMYQIAMRFARKGIEPILRTSERLNRDLVTAITKDQSLHEKKLSEYCDCPILFIDDWGKEVVSQRTQSDFFEIITHRTDNEKPIIFTTNLNRDQLISRYPDKVLANSAYERIKETSQWIRFK
jgi:DNA replication protein DnaC